MTYENSVSCFQKCSICYCFPSTILIKVPRGTFERLLLFWISCATFHPLLIGRELYFLLGLVILINNRWLYIWGYNFHDLHLKHLLYNIDLNTLCFIHYIIEFLPESLRIILIEINLKTAWRWNFLLKSIVISLNINIAQIWFKLQLKSFTQTE